MTIPFKKLKDEWMKDSAFRAEYEELKPEFALALRTASTTVSNNPVALASPSRVP